MTKAEILNGALALNNDSSKYKITVENDTIITEVNWMNATFFAPGQVTDEMRNFKYMVKIFDNNKYSETDLQTSSTTSVSGSGLNKNFSKFQGKTITFDKTIGVGKDKNTDETGIINTTFYSEDYKKPVRDYLKQCGCKKKMSKLSKILIFSSIAALVIVAAILIVFASLGLFESKTVATPDKFISVTEKAGFVYSDETDPSKYANTDKILLAEKENMYIIFYDLNTKEFCDNMYQGNVDSLKEEYSANYTSLKGVNHARTELTGSNGKYVIISKIEDTLILAETIEEHKDELNKIVEELGY